MTVRSKNMLMGLTAATAALGGAAILAIGLTLPVEVEPAEAHAARESRADSRPAATQPAADREPAQLKLENLQRLCDRDLRAPLIALAAPVVAEATQPSVPVAASTPVRLIGTIIEPGHSMAVFQKSDGSIALCAIDQTLTDGGMSLTVARIERHKVIVRNGAETHELTLPPSASEAQP